MPFKDHLLNTIKESHVIHNLSLFKGDLDKNHLLQVRYSLSIRLGC